MKGLEVRNLLFSKTGIALGVFLSIAGYFLWTEHRAHVITFLPFLLVGGCILMHVFMHGGHGNGDDRKHRGHDADKGGGGG